MEDTQQKNETHALEMPNEITIAAIIAVSIIGLIFNIIYTAAIANNKVLKTRSNKILQCYLSLNIGLQLMTPFYFTPIFTSPIEPWRCILISIQVAFELFENIAFNLLSTDCIVLSKKLTDKAIIATYVICMLLLIVVLGVLCGVDEHAHEMLVFGIEIIGFLLLVLFVIQDIFMCCRGRSGQSDESKMRLNVARIYVYMLTLVVLGYSIDFKSYEKLVYTVEYMICVFIFWYVYRNEEKFRICVSNLFRKKENRRAINANNVEA